LPAAQPPTLLSDTVVFHPTDKGIWNLRHYGSPNAPKNKAQVLLSGVTYDNGKYWEAPADGAYNYTYSYVNYAGGYSDLFVIDQNFKKVSGDVPTIGWQAQMLEQTLKHIHEQFGYTDITCIGHSVGSAEMIFYAGGATQKCTRLVVTGFVNTAHALPGYITPALINQILADEYTVYPEFIRSRIFYSEDSEGWNPAAPDYDNVVLETPSFRARLLTALTSFMMPGAVMPEKVKIPTLLISGDQDALYPGSFLGTDARMYYTGTKAETFIQNKSGHALNFHLNREEGWKKIKDWILTN